MGMGVGEDSSLDQSLYVFLLLLSIWCSKHMTQLLSVYIIILSLNFPFPIQVQVKCPRWNLVTSAVSRKRLPQKPGAMEGAWRSMGNSLREATLGGNLVAAWWKPSGVLVSWCGLWRWQEGGKPGGKEAWGEMAHLHSCQGASSYENLARISKALLRK